MSRRTASNGFTLMELSIVIGVICILAAMIVAGVLSAGRLGKRAAVEMDIKSIYMACAEYKSQFASFPDFPSGSAKFKYDKSDDNNLLNILLNKTRLVSLDQSRMKKDGGTTYFFDPFGKPYATDYTSRIESGKLEKIVGIGPDSSDKYFYMYAKGETAEENDDKGSWIYLKGGK